MDEFFKGYELLVVEDFVDFVLYMLSFLSWISIKVLDCVFIV